MSYYKNRYYNIAFNVIAFLIFIIVIGLTLNYKYREQWILMKNKKRTRKEKIYFRSNTKNAKIRKNNSMDLITNLPIWKNEM